MRVLFLNAAMACFFATLSGCATQRPTTRSVDTAMILPAGAERTRMKPGEKFLMPVPVESPSPRFPEAATQPAVHICVEIVVSEEGLVGPVRQIDTSPDCESPGSEASAMFFPPVREAVETWTYFGAALCEYATDESQCDQGFARLTPVAVKLAYRFEFSQAKGTRRVSSEKVE